MSSACACGTLRCRCTVTRRPAYCSRECHVWRAAGWADIQMAYFRGQGRGAAFQSKLKDKWRTLCKGLRDKNSCRSNISLSLWDRVEKLAKSHGMR